MPTNDELRKLVGALVYFGETGTTDPPERSQTPAQTRELSEQEAEIARLRDQVEQLQGAGAQQAAPAPGGEAPAEQQPPAVTT